MYTGMNFGFDDILNKLHETFPLEKASPKTASDILAAYGYDVKGSEGTALRSEYSVPHVGVTNKAEFFRWPSATCWTTPSTSRPSAAACGWTWRAGASA